MRGRAVALASWTGVLLLAAGLCLAQPVLYGGNQYLQVPSVNSGWLVTVNVETGACTPVGQPAGVARLSGLAFDADGTLWAATVSGGASGTLRTSTLIQLDPSDGSIVATIGAVVDADGGEPVGLESLAIQPGTNALLATRGISDQNFANASDIYRIDKATAVASLFINNTGGYEESSIAFAPDGSLYQSVSNCCAPFGFNPKFQRLDPSTGEVLSSVSIPHYFKAMAFREDGALFGAITADIFNSDASEIYRIHPSTGAGELVGETGHNPIGALVFGADARPSCVEDDSCFGPRTPAVGPSRERPAPRKVVRPQP